MTRFFHAMDATWPAATTARIGPWLVRAGPGGGKRVSSVSAEGRWTPEDIETGAEACRALGQAPLFQVRDGDGALDAELARQGYGIIDPVDVLACKTKALAQADIPRLSAFTHWPPLAMAESIWEDGGIDPARLAVMRRVQGPRTCLLGRHNNHACATAFVAIHDGIAMLHALHVLPSVRRQGIAQNMMHAAARWAQERDAQDFAVVVVSDNKPAQTLYAALGLCPVGHYLYRIKEG